MVEGTVYRIEQYFLFATAVSTPGDWINVVVIAGAGLPNEAVFERDTDCPAQRADGYRHTFAIACFGFEQVARAAYFLFPGRVGLVAHVFLYKPVYVLQGVVIIDALQSLYRFRGYKLAAEPVSVHNYPDNIARIAILV